MDLRFHILSKRIAERNLIREKHDVKKSAKFQKQINYHSLHIEQLKRRHKFYDLELIFENVQHKFCRGVLEAILQHLFSTDKTKRELSHHIRYNKGIKKITLIDLRQFEMSLTNKFVVYDDEWWKGSIVITHMK